MNRLKVLEGGVGGATEPFEDLSNDRAVAGQSRARREGSEFDELAFKYVESAGGKVVDTMLRIDGAVTVDARLLGANGRSYWMLGHGNVDDAGRQPGLQRTDTVMKTIAAAFILSKKIDRLPILVITSHLPKPSSAAGNQLAAGSTLFLDVIATKGDLEGYQRLQRYMRDQNPTTPTTAPWMLGESSQPTSSGRRRRLAGQMRITIEGDDD